MGTARIGVFGGTFNPIHRGHLHIAHRTKSLFDLDEIHSVVAASPPHKPNVDLALLLHRFAMVSLATAAVPSFIPSLIELEDPASPYSVRTMEKFALLNSGNSRNVFFIGGGDSLLDVAGWHESGELLRNYNFVFVTRPGVPAVDPGQALPALIRDRIRDLRGRSLAEIRGIVGEATPGEVNRIFILDARAPDVSSSQVRLDAAGGRPIGHLVPAAVRSYIQKLHLYGER